MLIHCSCEEKKRGDEINNIFFFKNKMILFTLPHHLFTLYIIFSNVVIVVSYLTFLFSFFFFK